MFLGCSKIEKELEKFADKIDEGFKGGAVFRAKVFGVPWLKLTVKCEIERAHPLSILQYFILKAAATGNEPISVQDLARALELDSIFIEIELKSLLNEGLVRLVGEEHYVITDDGRQSYETGNLKKWSIVQPHRLFLNCASGVIRRDDGKFLNENTLDEFPLPPDNYKECEERKIYKLCDVGKVKESLMSSGIYSREHEEEIVRILNICKERIVYRQTALFLVQSVQNDSFTFRAIDVQTERYLPDLQDLINLKTNGLYKLILEKMELDQGKPDEPLLQEEVLASNLDQISDKEDVKPKRTIVVRRRRKPVRATERSEKDTDAEIKLLVGKKIRQEFLKAMRSASQDLIIVSPCINRKAINDEVLTILRELGQRRVLALIGWGHWDSPDKEEKLPDPELLAEMQSIKTPDKVQSVAVIWPGREYFKTMIADHKIAFCESFNWLSYRGRKTNFIKQLVIMTNSPQRVEDMMNKGKSRFLKAVDLLWDKYVHDSSRIAERDSCICAWACLREPSKGLAAVRKLLPIGSDRLEDGVECLERLCLSQRGALKDGRAEAANNFLSELDKTIRDFDLEGQDNFSALERAQRLLREDIS